MFNKSKPNPDRRKRIAIRLPCNREWADESEVDIESIEEDMQGRDVVTFKCPCCGEVHTSHRYGR